MSYSMDSKTVCEIPNCDVNIGCFKFRTSLDVTIGCFKIRTSFCNLWRNDHVLSVAFIQTAFDAFYFYFVFFFLFLFCFCIVFVMPVRSWLRPYIPLFIGVTSCIWGVAILVYHQMYDWCMFWFYSRNILLIYLAFFIVRPAKEFLIWCFKFWHVIRMDNVI